MGLMRELFGEYLYHRLYGRRHRQRYRMWGPPVHRRRPSMWGMQRLGGYPAHRHRRVQVRGCGCCLPIPLLTGLGFAALARRALAAAR